jgi:hypothetical protein
MMFTPAARARRVLVRGVEDVLVVGVGVHGGEVAALDAERLVQHLGQRRDAVGGAGRRGDDLMLDRVVGVRVDPGYERRVDALARRRDEDPAGTGLEVQRGVVAGTQLAGGLDDEVHPEIAPGQRVRPALGEDRNRVPADAQDVVRKAHVRAEPAERRVVLEQVGQRRGVVQIVDRDHLERGVGQVLPQQRPQIVAADPAEAVDRYPVGH